MSTHFNGGNMETPTLLGIPFWVLGLAALGMAGLYAVFVPRKQQVMAMSGQKFIILRWFHSLVWVLLAGAAFIMAIGNPALTGIAQLVAAAGGGVYVVYMATLAS
jgi:hypothetical protein